MLSLRFSNWGNVIALVIHRLYNGYLKYPQYREPAVLDEEIYPCHIYCLVAALMRHGSSFYAATTIMHIFCNG